MPALMTTALPGLPEPSSKGKVREMYDLGEQLLIVTTDRISAFDVVMANGIPDKGKVLNQLSGFWFKELADVCPNHLVTIDDAQIAHKLGGTFEQLQGRSTLGRKAKPLP